MIAPTALNTICFPWILVDSSGAILKEGKGSLFPKPNYQIETILPNAQLISGNGWGVCPNGYAMYRFSAAVLAPASVVLHGLKVNGISTARGRSETLSINIDKIDLVNYVQAYCEGLEALDDQYRALIRHNIHEVRGINSALYNAAFELQTLLDTDSYARGNTASISKSVVSLSELLRGRIDFMEFIANPSTQSVRSSDIAVYRKFDKVQRCFRVTAHKRGIEFEISGSSSKVAYGPPVFDLIPYLLLDNAVKYSPDKCPIKIVCNDGVSTIFCSVTSMGPRILQSELPDIFSAGMRGENALKSQKEGSGLGLSVLQKIIYDIFSGSISVNQSDNKLTVNGVPYCEVTFEIKIPVKSANSRS